MNKYMDDFHVVFTLPHLLNPIINRNKRKMYKLLFNIVCRNSINHSSRRKVFRRIYRFFQHSAYLGAKIKSALSFALCCSGRRIFDEKSKMDKLPKDYLAPIEVLKGRYKELYLKALTEMIINDELNYANTGYDKKALFDLKNKVYESEWVVYAKESFKNSDSVIKYLAKYTHRIAISNYRIIKLENDKVYFTYRDYRDDNKEKVMEMNALEFIDNFLNHVVPERFVRVRYYGLLSHRNKKKSIDACRTFYDIKIKPVKEYANWQEYLFLEKGFDVGACKSCGKGRMICIKRFDHKKERSPPCY